MSSRRVPLFCFAVLLLVGCSIAASAASFPDVPTDYWAWPQIQAVSTAGIATGYPDGTYLPEAPVSRDQMAVYIARALAGGDAKVPSGPVAASFPDVPTDYWAFKYIEYVKSRSIVAGYPDGDYHPTDTVTRDQMAVYISRAVVDPTGDTGLASYTPPSTPSFPDVSTDYWAYKYIEYAKAQGIVSGYPDGTYHPGDAVTRAQMAVYIARAFDLPLPPQPVSLSDYFPLANGDTWTYQQDDGKAHVDTVSGTVTLGGQTYTQLLEDGASGSATDFLVDAAGLHIGGLVVVDGSQTQTLTFDPALVIPASLLPGDTATLNTQVSVNGTAAGAGSLTYTFVDKEAVTTAAGSFPDCVKLEMNWVLPIGDNHCDVWLAKGVGKVGQDSRPFGGTQWQELIAASVGGTSYPASPYHITDYWPLDQGDTWAYNRTDTNGDKSTITQTITGTITLGGSVYSVLTELSSGGKDQDWYYLAATDGIHFDGVDDHTQSAQYVATPAMLFPNSLVPGGSTSATVSVTKNGAADGTIPYTVTFVGVESVTEPAGDFPNCLKVELDLTPPGGSLEHDTYWVAKGVGIVQESNVYTDGSPAETLQLTSATVAGTKYGS